MQMFIPPLGTKIRLLKDWDFKLHCEPRNARLWDLFHYPPSLMSIPIGHRRNNWHYTHLQQGDTLTVDRIYIRHGQTMFNSVTFKGEVLHAGNYHRVRFWASLEDVNNINGEVIT